MRTHTRILSDDNLKEFFDERQAIVECGDL